MIVSHHEVKDLKNEAIRRSEVAIDDADECAFWAAYTCGVGDTLDLIRETVNHI